MNLFISGIDGWIASALAKHCRQLGHEVHGSTRRTKSLGVVRTGDIHGHTDWGQAIADCDVVVHLAGRVHVMRDERVDPLACYRTVNTEATLALAVQAAALGVRRFVYISTAKVNGEHGTFAPDDIPSPQDAYAISKLEAELGLQQISNQTGMESVIIRPPLVYGPGVKGNFATMINWIRKGIPLPFGAIHNRRSLIALDNLVDFVALCADPAKSPQAANQIFLISDGHDFSTSELLRKVANVYGKHALLFPVPCSWIHHFARLMNKEAITDRLLKSLVVDSTKACSMLNWRPVITIDAQLEKMARHDTHI